MAAPSFNSFPPSFSSFPDIDSKADTTKDEKHDQRRSKQKDRERYREKHRHKHKYRSRHHSPDVIDNLPRKEENVDFEISQEAWNERTAFFSDRQGDPLNVTMSGLHAGHVPKYHPIAGGRRVLGLSSEWKITSRRGKGVQVSRTTLRRMPSLTEKKTQKLLSARPTRRIPPSAGKLEEIDGYLRLPHRRDRVTASEDQPYHSITLSRDVHDSESGYSSASETASSSSSEGDDDFMTSHEVALKQLEQELSKNLSSVDLWLRLLAQSLSIIPISSKNATKARSEIALSILSRALDADEGNKTSTVLWMHYMKAAEQVWNPEKVDSQWEKALKIGGADLWLEWLEWRIKRCANGVDGITEDASRAIRSMTVQSSNELSIVRVFWRTAILFKNAGFYERTVAMFQAQAALLFHTPREFLQLPFQDLLNKLEEYWESEVPRIGERNSQKWSTWHASGQHFMSRHSPLSKPTGLNDLDPYRQWAAEELQWDQQFRLPTRTADDSDPYSTIFFNDIRNLMMDLHALSAKHFFRLAWLSTLGLHVPGLSMFPGCGTDINWDDRWCLTYLTRPSYLDALFPPNAMEHQLISDSVAGVIVGRERRYAPGFGPVCNWSLGMIGPLNLAYVYGTKDVVRKTLWTKSDLEGVDDSFVRRLFSDLRLGLQDVDWDHLALAFEAACSLKGALKLSRSLLETARDSTPHWAAHGQLEQLRDRTDDARRVYQTVLIASRPAEDLATKSLLWWDWALMEWLSGNSGQAFDVVLRSASIQGQNSVMVLRAKRALEEAAHHGGGWKERECWIKLRALLELLTTNEPGEVFPIFDKYIAKIEGTPRESLVVASLCMIYHHGMTLRNAMPPALLSGRVKAALNDYPSNSIIIGLFLEGERGQGIWGHVRNFLGESSGRSKDVMRRVQEIWIAGWQKGRWMEEMERTRNGLAVAVEDERTRGSLVLWRMFIEFEIRVGELRRAKNLLYRAIGECPLAKELYMIAFRPLRSVFTAAELDKLVEVMAERGLRLHGDIEELLKGTEEIMENNDSLGSEDEIERDAKELKRLEPY